MNGTIERIYLEDFMPYSSIVFKPGKHVNLVIAPNGCGKSSLIAGIILGLGGRPQDIGRGTQLGTFVKAGCSTAKIEIQLRGEEGSVVIARHLTTENKSSWYINGSKGTHKQVEEIVAKMHIQVDNLCQVLPQDRVYEFSRMNSQTLLENTERSVGPEDLSKHHYNLKEFSKMRHEKEIKLADVRKRYEELSSQNKRLEVDIESMHRKQLLLNHIKVLKRQFSWRLYQDEYTIVKKLKRDQKAAQEIVDKLRTESEEKAKTFRQLRSALNDLEVNHRKKIENVKDAEARMKALVDQCVMKEGDIDRAHEAYEELLQFERRRQAQLESLNQHLIKLQNDLALTAAMSAEEVKRKTDEMVKKFHEKKAMVQPLRQEESSLQATISNIMHEIRVKDQTKKRFQDVFAQRLQKLQHFNKDAYQAYMWLQRNKQEFEQNVYGPIAMELQISDRKHTCFVEQAISTRDLLAFVFEAIPDMHKFQDVMKTQLNLRVNCVHSGSVHPPSSTYKPNVAMELLRPYGFSCFIKDMFTAPEAVTKYLFRQYRVYQIPVGSDKVDSIYDSVPVALFYSQKHRYSVRRSKYSGESVSTIINVNPSKLLDSGNQQELQETEESIRNLHVQREAVITKVGAIHEKLRMIDAELSHIKEERRKLEDCVEKRAMVESRIVKKKKEIADVESKKLNFEEEDKKCQAQVRNIVRRIKELQIMEAKSAKTLLDLVIERKKLKFAMQDAYETSKDADEQANEAKVRRSEQERICKNIADQLPEHVAQAKKLHSEALEMSDGEMPSKEIFVSGSCEEMACQIQELQAKADFLGEANDAVMQEFERKKKQIASLADQCETMDKELKELDETIQKTRERWLPMLEELVGKINQNFSRFFKMLGCSGEVNLSKQNPDAYDQYGIVIKVKFRDADQLQELNQYTQSGGERSVATALYMLSLQELTYVPFRIVDEINQGMDPVNERRVFELLVKATQNRETSQYFLLTPKLLPGLTYPENMTILTIMSGSMENIKFWDAHDMVQIYARRRRVGTKK